MSDADRRLVEALYEAFNRRDVEAIAGLCDAEMEFFPATAEYVGRASPYRGRAGLAEYLQDVAAVWEELLITVNSVRRSGDRLLVGGRVYGRSREFGIRDIPVAWSWKLRDGLIVRGEVLSDPTAIPAASEGAGR